MSDQCIIAKTKDGEVKVRSLENCGGRVPEGKLREMYAYCLVNGKNPTDIVETGIRTTYYDLRRAENEINGVGNRDVVPIKLVVGEGARTNTGPDQRLHQAGPAQGRG